MEWKDGAEEEAEEVAQEVARAVSRELRHRRPTSDVAQEVARTRAVRRLARAVCRKEGGAEEREVGWWIGELLGEGQLDGPAEGHAREMMGAVVRAMEERRHNKGAEQGGAPAQAAPAQAAEAQSDAPEGDEGEAEGGEPAAEREVARAGEPREPTGTERRGASMAAKGAEGITGQVEIGRMALNTRRPTVAAQAGVQDVMADRVTKLGSQFVIPLRTADRQRGWAGGRGVQRDERYRPLVVRAVEKMVQELEEYGQSNADRIARMGPDGWGGWQIDGRQIERLPTHAEAVSRDPDGREMWKEIVRWGSWVASGRKMRLLCHCRETREGGARCRMCHCQPLAECIEREATRQVERGSAMRAAAEAAAFLDGWEWGGGTATASGTEAAEGRQGESEEEATAAGQRQRMEEGERAAAGPDAGAGRERVA